VWTPSSTRLAGGMSVNVQSRASSFPAIPFRIDGHLGEQQDLCYEIQCILRQGLLEALAGLSAES